MKISKRRKLTGTRRRGPIRKYSSNLRWMHLWHQQVSDRHRIQWAWIRDGSAASLAMDLLQQLFILNILITSNAIDPPNLKLSIIVDLLIQLAGIEFGSYCDAVVAWFRLDHLLHDISPLELSRVTYHMPHKDYRLADWDDKESRKNTGFLSATLYEIYNLFGLAQLAGNDGYIRISTGCTDSRGGVCHYRIHTEELFLFFMTRCYTGTDMVDMADRIFGGYVTRWEFGFPWMVRYLDHRYRNIIGHQGLLRYRDQFPRFFEAIEQYVKRPKWHRLDDGTWWWSPGLSACPVKICGFADCTVYKTCKPFSGPDGPGTSGPDGYTYVPAPRKRRYGVTQEAFHTGHRCRDGVKIENFFLPNGISTIFGPVSCRRPDVSGGASVQDMSGLNNFLRGIQRNRPNLTPPYAGFGDYSYGVNLECLRSYYWVYFPPAQLTEYMNVCDAEFKSCRQGIEWYYGKTENIFSICKNSNNFKMGQRNPVS